MKLRGMQKPEKSSSRDKLNNDEKKRLSDIKDEIKRDFEEEMMLINLNSQQRRDYLREKEKRKAKEKEEERKRAEEIRKRKEEEKKREEEAKKAREEARKKREEGRRQREEETRKRREEEERRRQEEEERRRWEEEESRRSRNASESFQNDLSELFRLGQILGLNGDFSPRNIRMQYLKLSVRYHPDKGRMGNCLNK